MQVIRVFNGDLERLNQLLSQELKAPIIVRHDPCDAYPIRLNNSNFIHTRSDYCTIYVPIGAFYNSSDNYDELVNNAGEVPSIVVGLQEYQCIISSPLALLDKRMFIRDESKKYCYIINYSSVCDSLNYETITQDEHELRKRIDDQNVYYKVIGREWLIRDGFNLDPGCLIGFFLFAGTLIFVMQ